MIAGPEAREKRAYFPYYKKHHEVLAKIEAEAFFNGYHLAPAFACGTCKIVLCPDIECSAILPGQLCRYPLKSRSSMEGVGMDVYAMAAKVGWDIYPIGTSLSPSRVPCGANYGLVLIY